MSKHPQKLLRTWFHFSQRKTHRKHTNLTKFITSDPTCTHKQSHAFRKISRRKFNIEVGISASAKVLLFQPFGCIQRKNPCIRKLTLDCNSSSCLSCLDSAAIQKPKNTVIKWPNIHIIILHNLTTSSITLT